MSTRSSAFAAGARADVFASALISGSRLLQNGLGFLLSVMVLKKFGISSVGSLVIASVGVALQAGLFNFGLPHVLAKLPLPLAQRNAIGFLAAVLGTLVCLPASLAIGAVFGRDAGEQLAIAAFAFGGVCFAHAIILDALLVLQGRVWLTYLTSFGAAVGMLVGYLRADTLAEFALYLTFGRLAGVYILFATLKYEWCSWSRLASTLRAGAPYVVPDMLGLASEQLGMAVLSAIASRADLGLFGLCRQFITAAETPLWSRLMALYPGICADPARTETYARQMGLVGLAIGASVAVMACALALLVFHSPPMLVLVPLLMCAIPFRYRGGTAEFGLRAIGRTAVINRLGAIRISWLVAWPVGFAAAGMAGVAMVVVLQSACMAWLSLDAFRQSTGGARRCS